jgi:hypothetical protein
MRPLWRNILRLSPRGAAEPTARISSEDLVFKPKLIRCGFTNGLEFVMTVCIAFRILELREYACIKSLTRSTASPRIGVLDSIDERV